MRIALTAFTRRGAALARTLAAGLARSGHVCAVELGRSLDENGYERLSTWTAARFAGSDALVFVSACGIAVRAVAPCLRDKFTDPAVVCLDEAGRVAVPLLGGHVGGANALAGEIAALTGGIAAVGTATDLNGLLSIDVWAVERGLTIADRSLAKAVSAALLNGETVGFQSDFPVACPEGLTPGSAGLGVWVTARTDNCPFPRTLRLVPRRMSLGIGCRRGATEEAVSAAVRAALTGWDPAAVRAVCTIDLKRDEPALLALCRTLGVPLTVYTAEQLRAVEGAFSASDFVRRVTGVENVCERAAAAGGGTLVLQKHAENGVTVAAAVDHSEIRKTEGDLP